MTSRFPPFFSGLFYKAQPYFVARTISHSFASLTREILFLPLEHKIHIFSPPCNILYICLSFDRAILLSILSLHTEKVSKWCISSFFSFTVTCLSNLRCLSRHKWFLLESYLPQDNALPRDLAVDNHMKLKFLELCISQFQLRPAPPPPPPGQLLLRTPCLNTVFVYLLCTSSCFVNSGAPRAPKARARGAPYLRKCGNPSMWENLVL